VFHAHNIACACLCLVCDEVDSDSTGFKSDGHVSRLTRVFVFCRHVPSFDSKTTPDKQVKCVSVVHSYTDHTTYHLYIHPFPPMSFVRLYFMELDSSDDDYDNWSTEVVLVVVVLVVVAMAARIYANPHLCFGV
jgi:hypothetical protein